MDNIMVILSEAIRKGAKPLFTAEGNQLIAEYINGNTQKTEKVGA